MSKPRRKQKIEERQKKELAYLESKEASSATKGLTAQEVADGVGEPVTTVRSDLSRRGDIISVDESREPYKYYVKRRHS